MTKTNFDLEERTFQFSRNTALYVKRLPKDVVNIEYGKQIIRSSGSIGANYIEANESLSKKDFLMRVKISRKEAKETIYWIRLIVEINNKDYQQEGMKLFQEATELKKILSAIIENSQ